MRIVEELLYFKSNLTVHKRIHTRDKQFRCDICEKAFSQKAHLSQHILVHSGVKQYICENCGKGFSGLTSFKLHQNYMKKMDS